jgi:predicted phosphodiesterase
LNWKDIKNKYCIRCNHDTIRKASQTPWGGQFVYAYLKDKEAKSKNIDVEKAKSQYGSETSINNDGSRSSNKLIEMSEEESKDVSYILKAHGFDPKVWELSSAKNNIWNVYSKQDGISTLYSSKITVKPTTSISLELVEEFYKELCTTYTPPKRKYSTPVTSGTMLEVPIFDLHYSKLALYDEVGSDYNSEIAKNNFNQVIDEIIDEVSNKKIEKIIFPIGNDFFNFDTSSGSTSGGTPQDNDCKFSKMFKDGCLLLIDGIKKLSDIAPVEVFCVNGNHDFMTSYHATMTMWAFFHDDEKVNVDISISPRKYVEFGNCLIGFSHGDKEKARIDGIMQVESRESWGRTLFREWHLGHLHSEQTTEKNGIIIRNLSSVTGTDTWHHQSGYVGAIKKCQCFLWDKKNGLKSIFNVVIK